MGKPRMLGYIKPYTPNNRGRQRCGVPNREETMSKKDWRLLQAYLATGYKPEELPKKCQEDCIYRGRHQKCSCCARNRHLKDCYEAGPCKD